MEPYIDNLAEGYVQFQDRNGDPDGNNFNGGVLTVPISYEAQGPIGNEIREPITGQNDEGIEGSLAAATDMPIDQPPRPKYRQPTEEEKKQIVSDIKAFGTLGAGAIGLGLGPAGGAAATTGAGFALEKFSPSIEKLVGNQATIPVYENWDESDFWNAYHGS